MQEPSDPESRNGPSRFIRSIVESVQSGLVTWIVGGLGVVVGGVLLWSWSSIKDFVGQRVDDQVIDAIDNDLNSEKSKLQPIIDRYLTQRMREKASDIGAVIDSLVNSQIKEKIEKGSGALTFGEIVLDKNNPATTIHIVDPPSHSGQLFIKASGLAREAKLLIIAPNSNNQVICEEGSFSFPLDDFFKPPLSAQQQIIENLPVDQKGTRAAPDELHFKHFHSITMRLFYTKRLLNTNCTEESDAEMVDGNKPIKLKYITIVYPPIGSAELK